MSTHSRKRKADPTLAAGAVTLGGVLAEARLMRVFHTHFALSCTDSPITLFQMALPICVGTANGASRLRQRENTNGTPRLCRGGKARLRKLQTGPESAGRQTGPPHAVPFVESPFVLTGK